MESRMREITHPPTTELNPNPGGLGDFDDGAGGLVTVLHAPYTEQLPVGELSVGVIRERFSDRLDIHPEAVAYVDGNPVDAETVVHEGQRLMFMRPSGEKGFA
jgi:hypothetical protein